jgi:hypothetical protein
MPGTGSEAHCNNFPFHSSYPQVYGMFENVHIRLKSEHFMFRINSFIALYF